MPTFTVISPPARLARNFARDSGFRGSGDWWTTSASAGFINPLHTTEPMPDNASELGWRFQATNANDTTLRSAGPLTASSKYIPVIATNIYSLSVDVYAPNPPDNRGIRLQVLWYDVGSGGTSLGSSTSSEAVVPANTRQRLTFENLTPTAGATHARIRTQILTSTANDVVDYFSTNFMFNIGSTANAYFDGTTDDGINDYIFEGTPHESISSRYVLHRLRTPLGFRPSLELRGPGPFTVEENEAAVLREAFVRGGKLLEA